MRPSSLKTTVAVLRTTLGMNQAEFAKLVGCSVSTIASVEMGPHRMELSADLAAKISRATGIGWGWLLDNNPSAPIVDYQGDPYTVESWKNYTEIYLATKYDPADLPAPIKDGIFDLCTHAAIAVDRVCTMISFAIRSTERSAVLEQLQNSLADAFEAFGIDVPEEEGLECYGTEGMVSTIEYTARRLAGDISDYMMRAAIHARNLEMNARNEAKAKSLAFRQRTELRPDDEPSRFGMVAAPSSAATKKAKAATKPPRPAASPARGKKRKAE